MVDRKNLFIKKCQQCCVLFDFTDPLCDLEWKIVKGNALQEMIEYLAFKNVNGCNLITEVVYEDIFYMVSINFNKFFTQFNYYSFP